ncbi:MAG: EVE domain-containing protein [Bacteroidia bacterium]|nr:EVE domain-containing protein [Bacteroidia bacterium]
MKNQCFWLFKTEAESYSIDDLQRDGNTCWDGVRNYQARNMLRDEVKVGDGVLFYHSNGDPPAIVGIAGVTQAGYPDHTQFETGHAKFDPRATVKSPRWFMVDISFVEKFRSPLPLESLRDIPELADMELLRKGSRLSVQPVRPAEWKKILAMAKSSVR